ncbi:MAG: hypothetical protein Greene041679_128 [Parcubacteria group bacterium Greene0416_79]|nr:MAG: hypothetical protein Greene041679_128 [Parcubacteria group bacterium Greene0416_79]
MRTGIRLNRPWQQPIVVAPEQCPFCTDQANLLRTFENGYKLIQNSFTPFDYHIMVVPATCWPEERLRVLGGEKEIRNAFENIITLLRPTGELWVQAYVGPLAGQNISHLHYHMIQPKYFDGSEGEATQKQALQEIEEKETSLIEHLAHSKRVFLHEGTLRVVIESIFRAGQCFILDTSDEMNLSHFAVALSKIVAAYVKAFQSNQGLAPDFQIFLKFSGKRLVYGSYLPILNHLGTTETVGAIISGGPFTQPWGPDETIAALKKVL